MYYEGLRCAQRSRFEMHSISRGQFLRDMATHGGGSARKASCLYSKSPGKCRRRKAWSSCSCRSCGKAVHESKRANSSVCRDSVGNSRPRLGTQLPMPCQGLGHFHLPHTCIQLRFNMTPAEQDTHCAPSTPRIDTRLSPFNLLMIAPNIPLGHLLFLELKVEASWCLSWSNCGVLLAC